MRAPDQEMWGPLAYRLWRRNRMTWLEISSVLACEGWCVPPAVISAVILERVGCELNSPRRGVSSDA